MSDTSIASIITTAASITQPLALSGLGMGLFFGMLVLLFRQLGLQRYPSKSLPRLILVVATYAFILSLTALVAGVSAWTFANYLGPYLLKQETQSRLLRQDYTGVIKIAEPYIKTHPYDDDVRHQLGTSYYATNLFDKGRDLYTDMLDLYKDNEPCSDTVRDAASSLAAMYIGLNKPSNAYTVSSKIIGCRNNLDGQVFNHAKIRLMLGLQIDESTICNYQFKRSYFRSKFALLQYAAAIQSRTINKDDKFYLIKEAFCYDEKIKSLIQGRFTNNDISFSPLITQNYDYEIDIIKRYVNLKDREDILEKLKTTSCAI